MHIFIPAVGTKRPQETSHPDILAKRLCVPIPPAHTKIEPPSAPSTATMDDATKSFNIKMEVCSSEEDEGLDLNDVPHDVCVVHCQQSFYDNHKGEVNTLYTSCGNG